ncbi:hypothetical protein QUB70_11620 [Microcoleus sp. A003_D6]|uniref:hypothetical protein n=1 Tax=Microcoleus sp. A003_D6 TaxID=3055266 RepID=UPI002FD5027A
MVDRPLQLFYWRRAIALFGIVPVDRPLQLFYWRRAILFEGFANALFVSKCRSPFTTFSRAKGDRSFCIERSIALYDFFTREGRSLLISQNRIIIK